MSLGLWTTFSIPLNLGGARDPVIENTQLAMTSYHVVLVVVTLRCYKRLAFHILSLNVSTWLATVSNSDELGAKNGQQGAEYIIYIQCIFSVQPQYFYT